MYSPGKGFPAYFVSAGFGSNVSTCEAPPLRKKCTTLFALGAKCGMRADSGLTGADCTDDGNRPASPNKAARLTAPMPIPHFDRNSRRLKELKSPLSDIIHKIECSIGANP